MVFYKAPTYVHLISAASAHTPSNTHATDVSYMGTLRMDANTEGIERVRIPFLVLAC